MNQQYNFSLPSHGSFRSTFDYVEPDALRHPLSGCLSRPSAVQPRTTMTASAELERTQKSLLVKVSHPSSLRPPPGMELRPVVIDGANFLMSSSTGAAEGPQVLSREERSRSIEKALHALPKLIQFLLRAGVPAVKVVMPPHFLHGGGTAERKNRSNRRQGYCSSIHPCLLPLWQSSIIIRVPTSGRPRLSQSPTVHDKVVIGQSSSPPAMSATSNASEDDATTAMTESTKKGSSKRPTESARQCTSSGLCSRESESQQTRQVHLKEGADNLTVPSQESTMRLENQRALTVAERVALVYGCKESELRDIPAEVLKNIDKLFQGKAKRATFAGRPILKFDDLVVVFEAQRIGASILSNDRYLDINKYDYLYERFILRSRFSMECLESGTFRLHFNRLGSDMRQWPIFRSVKSPANTPVATTTTAVRRDVRPGDECRLRPGGSLDFGTVSSQEDNSVESDTGIEGSRAAGVPNIWGTPSVSSAGGSVKSAEGSSEPNDLIALFSEDEYEEGGLEQALKESGEPSSSSLFLSFDLKRQLIAGESIRAVEPRPIVNLIRADWTNASRTSKADFSVSSEEGRQFKPKKPDGIRRADSLQSSMNPPPQPLCVSCQKKLQASDSASLLVQQQELSGSRRERLSRRGGSDNRRKSKHGKDDRFFTRGFELRSGKFSLASLQQQSSSAPSSTTSSVSHSSRSHASESSRSSSSSDDDASYAKSLARRCRPREKEAGKHASKTASKANSKSEARAPLERKKAYSGGREKSRKAASKEKHSTNTRATSKHLHRKDNGGSHRDYTGSRRRRNSSRQRRRYETRSEGSSEISSSHSEESYPTRRNSPHKRSEKHKADSRITSRSAVASQTQGRRLGVRDSGRKRSSRKEDEQYGSKRRSDGAGFEREQRRSRSREGRSAGAVNPRTEKGSTKEKIRSAKDVKRSKGKGNHLDDAEQRSDKRLDMDQTEPHSRELHKPTSLKVSQSSKWGGDEPKSKKRDSESKLSSRHGTGSATTTVGGALSSYGSAADWESAKNGRDEAQRYRRKVGSGHSSFESSSDQAPQQSRSRHSQR